MWCRLDQLHSNKSADGSGLAAIALGLASRSREDDPMSDASRVKTIARLIALAVGAMLMPSMAPAATVDDVKGHAAVVAAPKQHKPVGVIARLANPAGTGMPMAPAAVGQQAGSLTRAMAAVGV